MGLQVDSQGTIQGPKPEHYVHCNKMCTLIECLELEQKLM